MPLPVMWNNAGEFNRDGTILAAWRTNKMIRRNEPPVDLRVANVELIHNLICELVLIWWNHNPTVAGKHTNGGSYRRAKVHGGAVFGAAKSTTDAKTRAALIIMAQKLYDMATNVQLFEVC
jgi:hypothetical protein